MSFMFDKPALDFRGEGFVTDVTPSVDANDIKTITHIISFDCLLNGFMLASSVTKLGSYITAETQYFNGTNWIRYKKFIKRWNLIPNCSEPIILFPTKPKQGAKVIINVYNAEEVDIKLAVNLFKFSDIERLNLANNESGEDW